MREALLVSLISLKTICLGNTMTSAHNEGNAFGKEYLTKEINQVDLQTLIPKEMQGQTFNPEIAKKNVMNSSFPANEHVNFLTSPDVRNNTIEFEDDYLFKISDEILNQANSAQYTSIETIEYTNEICQEADAPYPASCKRELRVSVIDHPEELGEVKTCFRHAYKHKFHSEKEAKRKVNELRESLARDPTIRWHTVDGPKGGGKVHRYLVEAHWEHLDDAPTCDCYGLQLKVIKEAWQEEAGSEWVYENIGYLKDPNCTFYDQECLDATPTKIINGKEVSRPCWLEKLTFLCSLKSTLDCLALKEKNCEFVKKECLVNGPLGCSLWELTFRCASKVLKRKVETGDLFRLDEELWQIEYDPNLSFADVSMKLAVFEAMQEDIRLSQEADPNRIHVFSGKTLMCSKNVADGLMYDCCFAFSGLAKKLKLAQCTTDEITLAEMREKGLCHYVGSFAEKFMDLWESRDQHVYCCFSSKLARVFQEQARQQLGIGWGDPKKANSRGLSVSEISSLDFAKLDLREAFTDLESRMTVRAEKKLGEFQEKVSKRIREQENNAA